jgi:hypothetical protein
MQKQKFEKTIQHVRALQKQIAELGPVMRGSVVRIGSRNKQYYFSLNKDGKTKLIYLGEKRKARAEAYSANYKKMRELAEEMTLLAMQLVKEDVEF